MRGEALAGGEQPEVGFGVLEIRGLERRDLREIRRRLVEAGRARRRGGGAEGCRACRACRGAQGACRDHRWPA